MPAKKTHEQFLSDLENKHPAVFAKYEILGKYQRADIKMTIRCKDCGLITESRPSKLMAGYPCMCSHKMNNEKFFTKLFSLFPDYERKFNYDGTTIDGSNSRIAFRCNDCGYLCTTQTAHTHLYGKGCPSCSKRPCYNKDLVIKRSTEKYGCNFDLSRVGDVSKSTDLISVGCPRHGFVEMTAWQHLRIHTGCVQCLRYDEAEIRDIFYSHPDNSHLQFTNLEEDLKGEIKVRFINMSCPEHGAYKVRLSGILNGTGCLKCYHMRSQGIYNKTLAERNKDKLLEETSGIYLVKLRSENLNCYKLGIAKDIKRRLYTLENTSKAEACLLYYGKSSAYDIITLEQTLLEKIKCVKYNSPIKFGGHTELFLLTDEDCSDLIELLSTQTTECEEWINRR